MYKSFYLGISIFIISHVVLPTPNRIHELLGKIACPNGITFQSNGEKYWEYFTFFIPKEEKKHWAKLVFYFLFTQGM